MCPSYMNVFGRGMVRMCPIFCFCNAKGGWGIPLAIRYKQYTQYILQIVNIDNTDQTNTVDGNNENNLYLHPPLPPTLL